MKKLSLLLAITLITLSASAQRIAVIDSKYILDKIPAYNQAQLQLDKFSGQWEQEIKDAFSKVEYMYKSYQAEASMLDDNLKKQRENAIMNKEKEAKELQKKYFGYEGALFKKREELVRPIQDQVYSAVQSVATKESYDLVLDKASGSTVFFNSTKVDLSNKVLKELNIK